LAFLLDPIPKFVWLNKGGRIRIRPFFSLTLFILFLNSFH